MAHNKARSMLFVMDPIESIKPYKDSTLAMMLAAQKSGWELLYALVDDLFIEEGQAFVAAREITVFDSNDRWFEYQSEPSVRNMGDNADIGVAMMRKDPPFDMEFVYSTYLLERAEAQGCLVVNKPQSLRDCNEKAFIAQFPDCCAPTLISRNRAKVQDFIAEHGEVILKPLDGMGGASIFKVSATEPNLAVILDVMMGANERSIMAQRFIPEITAGDKRILMVDGEPVDYALARIPAEGQTRGNIAAGGRGVGQPLSERDREICRRVGPVLKEKGLLFVGLDVIGDYLTEINVTSPTCIRELDAQFNLDIAGDLIRCIETYV